MEHVNGGHAGSICKLRFSKCQNRNIKVSEFERRIIKESNRREIPSVEKSFEYFDKIGIKANDDKIRVQNNIADEVQVLI